jgi:hypothetical protein
MRVQGMLGFRVAGLTRVTNSAAWVMDEATQASRGFSRAPRGEHDRTRLCSGCLFSQGSFFGSFWWQKRRVAVRKFAGTFLADLQPPDL